MSKLYVITATGRRSKPVTESQIRQMQESGKLPSDATVTQVGTVFSVPIEAFLEVEDCEEDTPAIPSPSIEIAPKVAPRISSQMRPSGESRVNIFPTQLFFGRMPTAGVDATRDYLKRVTSWLEFWIKILSFINVGAFCMFVGLTIFAASVVNFAALFEAIRNPSEFQKHLTFAIDLAGVRLFWAAITLVLYCVTMIIEAFLRATPAAIRYWIEVTEERRRTTRL